MRVLFAFAAAATTSAVPAAPTAFGTRTLEMPAPSGFVGVAASAPKFVEVSQAFLPAGNRLIEVYATEADRAALAAGNGSELVRYLQLQVPRAMEGKPVSQAEFSANAKNIETGLAQSLGNIGRQATDLAGKGNAQIRSRTGTDPGMAISDIGFHGLYRREDWGLFFTLSSNVSVAGMASDRLISAGAIVLINHQLVYFYAFSRERSAADAEWVKDTLSAWVDAVHAANPDDPALEKASRRGGFDWSRVLVFAAIGGLVGGLYKLFRPNA